MTTCLSIDIFNNITCLPEYAIAPDVTSVTEGDSVTFTVTTVNIPDGVTLYWQLESSGGSVTDSDFSSPANPVTVGGTVIINSNTASFVVAIADDGVTELSDTFIAKLSTECQNTLVAISAVVSINDAQDPTVEITVPGGSASDINYANDTRWSGDGSIVGYAVNAGTFGGPYAPLAYVYNYNGGSPSLLWESSASWGDLIAIDFNSNGSKLILASDTGVSLYNRNGNNYDYVAGANINSHPDKNTFLNYTGGNQYTRARFAYNYTRILLGQSIFSTTPMDIYGNLDFITVLPGAPQTASFVSAWGGNSIVGYNWASSSLTAYAWRTTNGTTFTQETFPQLPQYGGTRPQVFDIEFNPAGNKVAFLTRYAGTIGTPAGLIYERVGTNNWVLTAELPSPLVVEGWTQGDAGSASQQRTICWNSTGTEVAIGGYMGALAFQTIQETVYMYSSSGTFLRKIAQSASNNVPAGLAYQPGGNAISLANRNNAAYFKIYQY